ncbi:unnamed protein product, partial [marine sediment metagenome]
PILTLSQITLFSIIVSSPILTWAPIEHNGFIFTRLSNSTNSPNSKISDDIQIRDKTLDLGTII